jgi:hypothetical protein
MANLNRAAAARALVFAGLLLGGCSGEGNEGIFTGSLAGNNTQNTATAPEPKVDPQCVSLVSRIDTLRREGIGDKIEKAAAKRYKMTQTDLGKADQLTKANAEFQMRCSTITPSMNNASLPPPVAPPPPAKTAKKSTPTGSASTTP